MPVYQTALTKRVLSRIRAVSNVRWNSGDLPTDYWNDNSRGRLNISDDPCVADLLPEIYFSPMSLWESGFTEDRVQCTEDEFVEQCRRMWPKSEQGD